MGGVHVGCPALASTGLEGFCASIRRLVCLLRALAHVMLQLADCVRVFGLFSRVAIVFFGCLRFAVDLAFCFEALCVKPPWITGLWFHLVGSLRFVVWRFVVFWFCGSLDLRRVTSCKAGRAAQSISGRIVSHEIESDIRISFRSRLRSASD